MRSGEEEKKKEEEEEKEKLANIKSNNPHLAGGEQRSQSLNTHHITLGSNHPIRSHIYWLMSLAKTKQDVDSVDPRTSALFTAPPTQNQHVPYSVDSRRPTDTTPETARECRVSQPEGSADRDNRPRLWALGTTGSNGRKGLPRPGGGSFWEVPSNAGGMLGCEMKWRNFHLKTNSARCVWMKDRPEQTWFIN